MLLHAVGVAGKILLVEVQDYAVYEKKHGQIQLPEIFAAESSSPQ